MVHGARVIYHQHKRKRIHQYKQKYPHPDSRIKFLDDLVMVVSVAIPLATLPQVMKIWLEKSAIGVSIWTWGLYLVLSIPMLVYGIVHKEKVIITMYVLWILIHISIVTGTIIYG